MIVGIHGSRNFNDYNIFIVGMAKSLYPMKDSGDTEFTIFSAGPHRINEMSREYLNVSNFKARGIKTKLVHVPASWMKKNHSALDHFVYFCNPKETVPEVVTHLSAKDVKVDIFRY